MTRTLAGHVISGKRHVGGSESVHIVTNSRYDARRLGFRRFQLIQNRRFSAIVQSKYHDLHLAVSAGEERLNGVKNSHFQEQKEKTYEVNNYILRILAYISRRNQTRETVVHEFPWQPSQKSKRDYNFK